MACRDHGLLTGAVFIDLRKADYHVDHKILIYKLESYGLKDTELDGFRNSPTNRKQFVSFSKDISDPCPITMGVHMGQFWALYSFSFSSMICL